LGKIFLFFPGSNLIMIGLPIGKKIKHNNIKMLSGDGTKTVCWAQ